MFFCLFVLFVFLETMAAADVYLLYFKWKKKSQRKNQLNTKLQLNLQFKYIFLQ